MSDRGAGPAEGTLDPVQALLKLLDDALVSLAAVNGSSAAPHVLKEPLPLVLKAPDVLADRAGGAGVPSLPLPRAIHADPSTSALIAR